MPQREQTKTFHTYSGGLITEVNPLMYPDNSVVDTENFEILIDGSLRRRKGLTPETGASFKDVSSANLGATTEHFWRNAGGETDTHFHIIQMGETLYIYKDDQTTLTLRDEFFNLEAFAPFGSSWSTDRRADNPIDVSWGRGHALITHPYTEPFYLEYDGTTITANRISMKIRDFRGAEDGTLATLKPTAITDAHQYNLQNAGWDAANITLWQTAKTNYPSLNYQQFFGFRRAETSGGTYDWNGIRTFDPDRLEDEQLSNARAPGGHFIVSPFNDTAANTSDVFDITTWTATGGGPWVITVTTGSAHGLAVSDTIQIDGQLGYYLTSFLELYSFSFDGNHTVSTVPTTTTLTFSVAAPFQFNSWADQYNTKGQLAGVLVKPDGIEIFERPSCNAFFAGRVFYSGTPKSPHHNIVYFSQVILKDSQYGNCHQEHDPTDEYLPDITEADGGTITIADAGKIIALQPLGPSLLVLAANGVWEIGGGANGYFDALDYVVRKITDAGCISQTSVINAENQVAYASAQGAYRVFVNPEIRSLVAESITEEKVNTKWQNINTFHKQSMKAIYDPVRKRILWMYDTATSPTAPTWNYREILIFDTRLNAFYVHTFPAEDLFATDTYLKGFLLPENYTRAGEAVIKYLTLTQTSGIRWNEMTEANFSDLSEVDAAGHFITGYEHMQDATRDKQIKYLTTFMERVEGSALTLQARWDFADKEVTGKFTSDINLYRKPRTYIGDGGADSDDGYPVVYAKHQVSGQGQVVSLKFSTTADKEAHIYGWSIDFQGVQ